MAVSGDKTLETLTQKTELARAMNESKVRESRLDKLLNLKVS
jgi:hypothetical protein